MTPAPKHFVILGGGTSGWMAASALARLWLKAKKHGHAITLIESEDIGTVGVGEATIPPILDFLKFLNVSEDDFIRKTQATYKLAIQFKDWKRKGEDYWHPFGTLGPSIESKPLFQHWLREKIAGRPTRPLMNLSIAVQLALKDRFAKPSTDARSSLSGMAYALHFDAGLVAKYLRGYAECQGVVRQEGLVASVEKHPDGNISALTLKDGRRIEGDFFVDCSGFRALLIGDALGAPFEDWSHWLPCDRAVAVPSASVAKVTPYTIAAAKDAGWTWRIPLQSRTGNGYVYSSNFCDAEEATDVLISQLDGRPSGEVRHLRFTAGRRKQSWVKNCLSLGLASGFLEPLESTSIHLVFANLFRFFDHFPGAGDNAVLRDAFNQKAVSEIEEIRDFLVLHYCTSERRDTEFWRYVTAMPLPDSLAAKLEVFRSQGRIITDFYDLFEPFSWISVFDGMGIEPEAYDPLIDAVPAEFSQKVLASFADQIWMDVAASRGHDAALSEFRRQPA